MWFNFSEIEILVLQRLCEGSASPGELANALEKKNSFISRAIGKLLQKGMVAKNGREISLSQAAHSQSFKRLFDSRPNAKIETWLCKSAMDVLIVLAGFEEGADAKTLAEEVACSKPTMFKVLRLLYSAGVAGRRGNTVMINDRLVLEFAQNYANSIQLLILKGAKGHNFSIRIRKSVVVRTDANQVPQYFSQTGLSALANAGLESMRTSYDDFYFNLDGQKKNISTEEALIHALLITMSQQHQDLPVLGIFFAKNRKRLNFITLKNIAKKYRVGSAFEEIRGKAEFYEKMRRFE